MVKYSHTSDEMRITFVHMLSTRSRNRVMKIYSCLSSLQAFKNYVTELFDFHFTVISLVSVYLSSKHDSPK